jgi:RES domain-containing protein
MLWRISGDMPGSEAHELNGAESVASGGRWSRPGTALVYACTSPALACLETVVHLPPGPLPDDRFLVEIDIPPALWATRTRFQAAAHPGWDALPHGPVSQDWGMRWIEGQGSALACVPSVIAPEVTNVLINPAHPMAARILARKSRRWSYDPRLRDA